MGIKFEEFDIAHGCWENYIERFSFCLEASDITDDGKKKANLLAVCGSELYELIIALIAPTKISEVSYENIKVFLDNHFHPAQNEIVQSHKFYARNQKEGERIRDYIAQLRRLSIECNFSDLNRTLRDRLVCGLRDKEAQKWLLQSSSLTFEQACKLALAHETAGRDCSVIAIAGPSQPTLNTEVPMEINKIGSSKVEKQTEKFSCFRCGKAHRGECKFRWSKCHQCGKTGHIEAVCMQKKQNENKPHARLNGLYEDSSINSIRQEISIPAFFIDILLNNMIISMEVDSGCAYTLISEEVARQIWQQGLPKLDDIAVALKTWTDSRLVLLGKAMISVQYKGMKEYLPIFIAKGTGPSLVGRNWFSALNIHLNGVHSVSIDMNVVDAQIKNILQNNSEVFQEGLGRYTGPVVNITAKEGTKPKFFKSRPVPFALKERVYQEIERLEKEGVLEATPHSEWATPIVPVLKPDGSVRLCGDYRSTVNAVTDTDTYPLPTLSEAFAELQGGVVFTKIDLERAYTQVTVDEATAKLLTVNTPKGLYIMKRLAFGIKACPGIFQRLMASLLTGITGVAVLLDDIVITGSTIEEHNRRLNSVLEKLKGAGLRINKKKCQFAEKSVKFLGFIIDQYGIHPCREKIEEIGKTPAPRNVKELQAFLGLLNFYDRFLPHKATIAEPLYRLLEKGKKWQWEREHQTSFETLRKMLSSDDTLVHYDIKKKLILSCDASQYGLGVVLEHEMEDGSIRPIMFASRTMNSHERNYGQVDKEAAAIVFGLKKFHQFICGRKVIIKTDHKPLLGILDTKKPIPNIISPRMLRWALLLNSYDYELKYVEGKNIGNADALSRWPNHEKTEEAEFLGVLLIEETPIELEFTAPEVAKLTRKDKVLCKIAYWIRNGWPTKVEEEYKTYWQKREELSNFKQCILWGNRVILPEKIRPYVLEELHRNHDGIVITKAMARSYFWWPSMDKEIETTVKNCTICAENRNMPAQVTHQWLKPEKAWSRLHIDYAGPFQGKMFLILIDAFSKWPEVKIVPDLTSATLIRVLRDIFAEQGLPDTLVSDNGRSFVSQEFRSYLAENKIRQVVGAPYHPATNGQAERTVQTIKSKLKKNTTDPWNIKIPRMLYGLRTTPNSTNDKSPAELLNNRRFRTKFDGLNPLSYEDDKTDQPIERNIATKLRSFEVGQSVYVRNYGGGPRWLKGKVVKRMGICRYLVQWGEKRLMRHVNQMLKCGEEERQTSKKSTIRAINDDSEEDDEDEDNPIVIPPAKQWADIIGVSGPQDIVIANSHGDIPVTGNKRQRSMSPHKSPEYKRLALDQSSSDMEDEEIEEASESD